MISVLCGHSKKIHHFPDAADICAAAHCLDPNCQGTDQGMCVLRPTGARDADGNPQVECLGSFSNCLGYTSCNCVALPCPHIGPQEERLAQITQTPKQAMEQGKRQVMEKMREHLSAHMEHRSKVNAVVSKPEV